MPVVRPHRGNDDDVRVPPGESATFAEPRSRGEFAVALERLRALDLP